MTDLVTIVFNQKEKRLTVKDQNNRPIWGACGKIAEDMHASMMKAKRDNDQLMAAAHSIYKNKKSCQTHNQ